MKTPILPETLAPLPSTSAAARALHQDLGIVTWVFDPRSGQTEWSGDLSQLLGLAPGSCDGVFAGYLQALHPADREMARRRMRAAIDGQLEAPFRAEERVIWPDGTLHWLEAHARPYFDAEGHVTHVAGVLREVAQHHVAQEGEARFRQLIEQAPAAMCIQRGFEIIYANARFADLFGFTSAAAVVGTPVLDLVAPELREAMALRYARRQASLPEPTNYEIEGRRLDGQTLHLLVSATTTQLADGPAVQIALQDLGDVVRARQALQQEHKLAQQYLAVAQATLVVLDCDGRVSMLNPKGHQLLCRDDGELLGRNWFEQCVPPDGRERVVQAFREIVEGRREPAESTENEVITRDGRRRLMRWRTALLRDEQGRITGTLSSGEDITDQRRAERELRALNQQLERRVGERTADLLASNTALAHARDAAEAGARAKSAFLANMSHEIRTPMNAVLGMSELALRLPSVDAKARDYLRRIHDAGQSLLEIIDELLDFSKIESGRFQLEPREFDLSEVIEHVRSVTAQRATDKGLDFQLDISPDVPGRLIGDALRIGQVLINLCGNAVKFTAAGRIVLKVDRGQRAQDAEVRLRFSVRDTGVGISTGDQARLFQPFSQIDASSTRRHGGTGLGLAICRQLVELMGGTIGVSSEPGRGSDFHFEMPLGMPIAGTATTVQTPALACDEAGVAPTGAQAAASLRGRHILIVEDNELNRIVASDMLRELAGAEVVCAGNGREALVQLEQQHFDLVLMDVQMPVMDGYEATRRIRSHPRLATLPVVAVTANAMPRDREWCRAAGMDDFVAKPYRPQALFDTLARVLRGPAPARSAACSVQNGAAVEVPAAAPVAWAIGLEQCMGQEVHFRRILARFIDGHAEDPRRIDGALEQDAPGDAAEVAHKLVSSAGIIGALKLSAMARELQETLRDEPPAARPDLLAKLRAEHAVVVDAVRARLVDV